MCGICGYLDIDDPGLLGRMMGSLAHRGPDSEGRFEASGAGLGHRRLSIIDVAGGHQPIENEDSSLVLVMNGEIYNHEEIRAGLLARGHRFRTRSDSEVALHLFEERGPDCVKELGGMFAFAIFDRSRRRLFLARDRLGIKPLYYAETGGGFLFASELKALLRHDALDVKLSHTAVREFLALRYVPGPGGMLEGVMKLPAAHHAVVEPGRPPVLTRYWRPELHTGPFLRSEEDYLEEFAERFERSIERRLMSEVPFGAYLSAGVDSGTIVAAMARKVSSQVRTFSVGFEYEHDELSGAAEIAESLGCEHNPIVSRISDVELLPKIVYHLDEPVGDPIVIPMYRLAKEAKRHLTVILTGEGADEIMGGYLFHKAILRGQRLARPFPRFALRRMLAPLVSLIPARMLDRAFDYPARLGRRGKQKIVDFVGLAGAATLPEAYRHLISLFDARDMRGLFTPEFESGIGEVLPGPFEEEAVASAAPALNKILHLQFDHWLPDDILTKQDKMSIASAIEGRVPFLDHELVEFASGFLPS